jgi:hypothetical protein
MSACAPVLDTVSMRRQPVRWEPTLPWAVTLALLTLVSLLSLNQVTEFLYFQF